jgi:hypothetical protein
VRTADFQRVLGVPPCSRSPHFADQLGLWADCERIGMHRQPDQARAAAVGELRLAPIVPAP